MPVINTFESLATAGREIGRQLSREVDFGDALRRTVPAVEFEIPGLERIRELVRASCAFPPNVDELNIDRWPQLVRVSAASRVGLAWAPRTEILEELLDATTPGDRDRILLDRAADVLADCRAALKDADNRAVVELVGFTTEAIAALPTFPAAAQALATNALETALNARYRNIEHRKKWFKETSFQPVDDEQTIGVFRLIISGCGIPDSYHNYELVDRDPQYSRNGTVHCANTTLYSRLNALKAITLATSWLVYEAHQA